MCVRKNNFFDINPQTHGAKINIAAHDFSYREAIWAKSARSEMKTFLVLDIKYASGQIAYVRAIKSSWTTGHLHDFISLFSPSPSTSSFCGPATIPSPCSPSEEKFTLWTQDSGPKPPRKTTGKKRTVRHLKEEDMEEERLSVLDPGPNLNPRYPDTRPPPPPRMER